MTEEARRARAAYNKKYRENMTEEQKAARREYAMKWRKANKDKVKANQARYWERKAEAAGEAATAGAE